MTVATGQHQETTGNGVAQGGKIINFGPFAKVAIQENDLVVLAIGPNNGNYLCDLTAIDLTLKSGEKSWDLAREVSPNVLHGNPHADHDGNLDVWHFFSEPDAGGSSSAIPTGSLVDPWLSATSKEEKRVLAVAIESLLQSGPSNLPK